MQMKNKVFETALPILNKLLDNGHEAFFVGGCVRDFLLGRKIKDIDIATTATPDEVNAIFPKVIPVGIEHGTVIVRHEGESYEVTTFQTKGKYTKKLHEDLQRRDFTINALAMDIEGEITDLFSGQLDMKNKQIKAVGKGIERFNEDPLRIIRALRFSSQIDFSIHHETLSAMIHCKPLLASVAVERITNEIELFFAGNALEKGFKYLLETKIYEELPVFKYNPNLMKQIRTDMKPLPTFAAVIVFFHFLDSSISIATWRKQWKCSLETQKIASHLYDQLIYHEKNGLDNTLVYHLNEQVYRSFIVLVEILLQETIELKDIIQIKNQLPMKSKKEMVLNGHQLLQLYPNKKPGPWIKEILDEIELLIVNRQLKNQMTDIKEWLRCNQQEIN